MFIYISSFTLTKLIKVKKKALSIKCKQLKMKATNDHVTT